MQIIIIIIIVFTLTVSALVYVVGDFELGQTLACRFLVAPVRRARRPVEMTIGIAIAFVAEFLLSN